MEPIAPPTAMRNFIKSLFCAQRRLDIVVLFVEYDRGIAGGSDHVFSTLRQYLQTVSGCQITYIRIDNKHEERALVRDGTVWTMGGNNRYREFSGWEKGVETIAALDIPCDLILFVNDMFITPGESFLKDYASRELFQRSFDDRTIIGRIDSTGQKYTVYGYDVSRWICSNCFVAPKTAIDEIGSLVPIKENINDFLEKIFPGAPLFKANAPMNKQYKVWLEEWLTTKWHSKFDLNETTWDLFRTKVRNIFNEALLTARFKEIGFSVHEYGDKKYY